MSLSRHRSCSTICRRMKFPIEEKEVCLQLCAFLLLVCSLPWYILILVIGNPIALLIVMINATFSLLAIFRMKAKESKSSWITFWSFGTLMQATLTYVSLVYACIPFIGYWTLPIALSSAVACITASTGLILESFATRENGRSSRATQ